MSNLTIKTQKIHNLLDIILPWAPSANQYWRCFNNRVLVSKIAREYKQEVAWMAHQWPVRNLQGRLEFSLLLHEPDRRVRDIDNYSKITLDALQGAHLFQNDSQFDKIIIERGEVVKNGELKVSIKEYKPS